MISWVTNTTAVPAARRRRSIERRDDLLVGEVEREQRLVAQQHRGVADQRLRHPQPLLLAAGEPSDRRVRVAARRPPTSSAASHPVAAHAPAAQPMPEAVTVEAEADEVAAAQRQVRSASAFCCGT